MKAKTETGPRCDLVAVPRSPTRLIVTGAKLALGGALFVVAANGCRQSTPLPGDVAQVPLALELASETADTPG